MTILLTTAQTEARNVLLAAVKRIHKVTDQQAIAEAKNHLIFAIKAHLPAVELERVLNTPIIRGSHPPYTWEKKFKEIGAPVFLKFEDFDSTKIDALKQNEHYLNSLKPLNVIGNLTTVQHQVQKKHMGLERVNFLNTLDQLVQQKYRDHIAALGFYTVGEDTLQPISNPTAQSARIVEKYDAALFEKCRQTELGYFKNPARSYLSEAVRKNDDEQLLKLQQNAKRLNDQIKKVQPLVVQLYALSPTHQKELAIRDSLYAWHEALDQIPQLKAELGLSEQASDQELYAHLEKLYDDHSKVSAEVLNYIEQGDRLGAWAGSMVLAHTQMEQLNRFEEWFKGKVDLTNEGNTKENNSNVLFLYTGVVNKKSSGHNGTDVIAETIKPFIALKKTFNLENAEDRAKLNTIWQQVNSTVQYKDDTESIARSISATLNPIASTQDCIANWELTRAMIPMSTTKTINNTVPSASLSFSA